MAKFRILHLTDFHINDYSDGSNEYLRKATYKEYIAGLTDKISSEIGEIDCIIATGDFIDKGKISNFDHAKEVLEFVSSKLNINASFIGTCIGNHDIDVPGDEGKLDYENENREKYYEFEKHFYLNSHSEHGSNPRFKLVEFKKGIYFLSIDSTLKRTDNKPGQLKTAEIDAICEELKRLNIDERENLLIIGCHYPLTFFEHFPFPNIEGWYEQHFWRSGASLKDRINATLNRCQVLWLFGDTHYPSHHPPKVNSTKQLFIMSGRIGAKTTFKSDADLGDIDEKEKDKILKELNVIHRQARVIEYNENNTTNIRNLEYSIETYADDSNRIYPWSITSFETYKKMVDGPEIISKMIEKPVEPDIERKILECVRTNNLYQFGRFLVREGEVSLGWMSLNSLLSDRNDILPILINDSHSWIKTKFNKEELEKSLLVGIDFWGSIFASNISVKANLKNYSKVNKNRETAFTPSEIFDQEIRADFSDIENLVFFTDVVSSGRTLHGVFDYFKSYFKKNDWKIKKTIAISVICDRKQEIKIDLDFLDALGTHCGLIRIPVVSSEFLPPDELLPPRNNLD